jgi:choline dehydrogenase
VAFLDQSDGDEKMTVTRRYSAGQPEESHRPDPGLVECYDFIVCGSGSSGSVVAGRLTENPAVKVLLLEAGGYDEEPAVMQADQWMANLGSERDWQFIAEPSRHVNGRALPMSMGKVLGGGSSINAMVWSRGHKNDWNFFAAEADDDAWSYESVLKIYRRIEDWNGRPDPDYRGTGGPIFVQPAPDPHALAPVILQAAAAVGIPTFENQNGCMMESPGGASISDVRIRDGNRQSVYRSYVHPHRDRPNLTVVTDAVVTRLILDGNRAAGVEVLYRGRLHCVGAQSEVVLSLGAIQTPKVLMQSGIGDDTELRRHDIATAQHLPGVGRNFQDHTAIDCMWENQQLVAGRNNGAECTFFWKSDPAIDTPDLQTCQGEVPLASAENSARFGLPDCAWILRLGVVRPESRGRIMLTGPSPDDKVQINANLLSHPDDLKAAIDGVALCREVGNSVALRSFVKREVMPGNLRGRELEEFVRDAALTYWHQAGTAKMGRDQLSVVDAKLAVYGIERLRIADASVMPRVTTGNTMAPCVIIGERAAEILKAAHDL